MLVIIFLSFLGNYSLSRVLPQIYSVNPDPIKSHIMTLVSILANCENSGKLALLSLFGHVAKDNPAVSRCNTIMLFLSAKKLLLMAV